MNIELIQGEFSAKDALDILTQMIHVKIQYHERAITKGASEEDSSWREAKIIRLQSDLYKLKHEILSGRKKVRIEAMISLEE